MTKKPKPRKAATFAEAVYSGLLEQLAELEAKEKAGAPVRKEIAVLQLLLRQQRTILKRRLPTSTSPARHGGMHDHQIEDTQGPDGRSYPCRDRGIQGLREGMDAPR